MIVFAGSPQYPQRKNAATKPERNEGKAVPACLARGGRRLGRSVSWG